jgi:hypothetical protein
MCYFILDCGIIDSAPLGVLQVPKDYTGGEMKCMKLLYGELVLKLTNG